MEKLTRKFQCCTLCYSFCVPDDIEYKYEVNGTERKSKLEVIKMKRNNEVFYAVLAENRPLSSLVKLVNQTGKLDKKSEAQVLIKEEELSVHFQVSFIRVATNII